MDPQGFADNSRLRASDADRDRAASVINSAMAEGRLTADEHSERLDALYAAKTHADIVPLLDDLPASSAIVAPAPPAQPDGPAGPADRLVAILSGATRKGTWRPRSVIDTVTVMGGIDLDFRDAVLPGREITIRVFCLMGGVDIKVPPEMHVVNNMVAILGGCDVAGAVAEAARPDAPVLRITGVCLLGGVSVRPKARRAAQDRRDAIAD